MLRSVSVCALAALAAAVLLRPSLAAEKAPQAAPPAADKTADAAAREHLQQALVAETQGDNDQRAKLLASALKVDPQLPAAHWHSGEIAVNGEWQPLAAAEQAMRGDPRLAEYRELRTKAASSARLVRDLAQWCERAGWTDLAQLHYSQLLSSSQVERGIQNEAVKKLGLEQVGGVWQSREEIQSRQEKNQAIETALSRWRPGLKNLQVVIDGEESPARDRALQELQSIDDPRSIAALETFVQDGGDRFQEEATKLLVKFPQYEATQALVRYAVLTPFVAARDTAIAGLKQRSKYEYLPLLLGGLVAPIKSQYGIQVGRGGVVQYSHAVLKEDAHHRVLSVANHAAIPTVYRMRFGVYEPRPVRGNNAFLYGQVYAAQNLARELEWQKSLANFQLNDSNRRVFSVLEKVTDAELPREPSSWWKWWQDYNEYYWPKPTTWAYENQSSCYFAGTIASCFVAGTPVRTQTGLVAIESLQPGDRVLSQDQDTGELSYKAVLRTTLRPPTKMVRIKAGSDDITTTLGHPFWVAGYGWKMAKQLQAGEVLHGVGGAVKIESVEQLAKESPAHNLVVDDFNTYFVGQGGLLVHDNEFRKPTRAIVPGLVTE